MFKDTTDIILTALAVVFALIIAFISPFLGLATMAGLIILYFVFRNPLNGIIFLAAYLPFETFLLKFVSGTTGTLVKIFSDALVVLIFFYTIFYIKHRKQKIIWPKNILNWLFLAFIIVWLISALVNHVDLLTSFSSLRQLLRYVLIFYTIIFLNVKENFVRRFLTICLSVLIIQAVLGLLQPILPTSYSYLLVPSSTQTNYGAIISESGTAGWDITQRISGTFGRYDKFGLFLSFFLTLSLGLYYAFKKSPYSKNETTNQNFLFTNQFLLLILSLGSLALIFTFSRMSWLGFLISVLLIGWLWQKDKKIKIFFISGLSLLIVYLATFLIISGFKISSYEETQSQLNFTTRILQTFSKYELENSYYGFGRIFFWINTPKIVVGSSPIIGVGPGLYGSGTTSSLQNHTVYNRLGLPFGIQDRMGQIDNNWLSLWGEYGTLGLLIFLSIFVAIFWQAKFVYKNSSPLIQGLSLGLMAICIVYPLQAFFGPYFEVRTIAFYFWSLAGIIISYKK